MALVIKSLSVRGTPAAGEPYVRIVARGSGVPPRHEWFAMTPLRVGIGLGSLISLPRFLVAVAVPVVVAACGGGGSSSSNAPAVPATALAVAGGYNHTVAFAKDTAIWAWGLNTSGQLANSTLTSSTTAIQVSGLSGVTAIDAGSGHNVALKSDGTVWTWGLNSYGQVGDGTTNSRYSPAPVSGLSGVVAIAGGRYTTNALKNDGTVWTWGQNGTGQLGDGTTTDRHTPVQVSGLTGAIGIVGGWWNHTVALKGDGSVWAWGSNFYGQIGDGTTINRSTPVQVAGLGGVTAIAAGYYHTVALKSDGTVWAWGYNGYGQLGDGTNVTSRPTPAQVPGLTGVAAIRAGSDHTIALKNDGTVWTWGRNYFGQLGDGTNVDRNAPVQASGLMNVVAVGRGDSHTVAIKSDGTIWAWGWNLEGQLGDGTSTNRNAPVSTSKFTAAAIFAPPGLSAVSSAIASTTVSWTASSGATGYKLYWSNLPTVSPTNGTAITLGNVTSHTHAGLTSGKRYYYVVVATNATTQSAASIVATAVAQ